MPRSVQTSEKSREIKKEGVKKAIEKKTVKKVVNKITEAEQKRRLKQRIKRLNQKIEEFSGKAQICSMNASMRLIKATAKNFGGDKVRMKLEALKLIVSATDEFVHQLLTASKAYIPKRQKMLQPEHIYKALGRPEFRQSIYPINARMELK